MIGFLFVKHILRGTPGECAGPLKRERDKCGLKIILIEHQSTGKTHSQEMIKLVKLSNEDHEQSE